ncbi:uncharacterized protein LOC120689913 isoform X2 [Panicum virgatum]|uniref:uncharacterized protein LOC120689913 isoform X1 n=1 Tax=Panicum virgatum TaxID=38727 RepID=UPI0019D5F3B2|nr:uncharacterized protein LOC120689913 isoform X1 [Panicum virgatum]XP_039828295.1 uncharacterized protein LOC120689913 isoform X2 [Panicum virgatum]
MRRSPSSPTRPHSSPCHRHCSTRPALPDAFFKIPSSPVHGDDLLERRPRGGAQHVVDPIIAASPAMLSLQHLVALETDPLQTGCCGVHDFHQRRRVWTQPHRTPSQASGIR